MNTNNDLAKLDYKTAKCFLFNNPSLLYMRESMVLLLLESVNIYCYDFTRHQSSNERAVLKN